MNCKITYFINRSKQNHAKYVNIPLLFPFAGAGVTDSGALSPESVTPAKV